MPHSLVTRLGIVTVPEFNSAWRRDPQHQLAAEAFDLATATPGRVRPTPPYPAEQSIANARAEIDAMLLKLDKFAPRATPSQLFPAAVAREALRIVRGAL